MPMLSRRRLLMLLSLPVLAGALTGFSAVARNRNTYYSGPVSDHFDGTRFFLDNHAPPKGFMDLMRWRFGGGQATWPETYPGERREPEPRVEGDRMVITYVGHASFLIQTAGLNILLDPVWSERVSPVSFAGPKRVNAPGVPFELLPPIDLVLVSHSHYDHLDTETLARLHQKFAPRMVVPLGNDTIIRSAVPEARVSAHDWGETVAFGDVTVHLEPMAHWSARSLFDRNHALWAAFVLKAPGGQVYFVGDTGFADGATFRHVGTRHPGLDTAILPIGAYEPRWFMRDQHMNPEEAVKAFELSGARQAIAHHWGTFQLTNEAIEDPLQALERALSVTGMDAARVLVLRPGQATGQTALA